MGALPLFTAAPPGMGVHGACRVVRGKGSLPQGSLVFYDAEGLQPNATMIGELIIAEVKGWPDLPFVRFLELGSHGELFTLRAFDGTVLEDVRLEWAALVKWVRLPTAVAQAQAVMSAGGIGHPEQAQ